MTNFNYSLFKPEPWMELGKCRGLPSDWFFIVPGEPGTQAKAVCRLCPVQRKCLEYALDPDNHVDAGIWGNTTEREREIIRGKRN